MKKYLSVLMSAIIAISLCGCSAVNENSPADTTTPAATTTQATEASVEAETTLTETTSSPETAPADTSLNSETTENSSTAAPDYSEETTPVTTMEAVTATEAVTTPETTAPTEATEKEPVTEIYMEDNGVPTSEATTAAPEEVVPEADTAHYNDTLSGDFIISEIHEDYFTANNLIPLPYTYVFNYAIGEDFCVDDQVAVTCEGFDMDDENFIITATPTSVGISERVLDENVAYKPVIYLYPEEETDVTVTLDFDGELLCTYPTYDRGWSVTAKPDGTLINKADGNEYSYLFWDGKSNAEYDFSKGFVVVGNNTAEFLREKLSYLGLTPREYNEFIVFWLPYMQNNAYNLITFQNERYTDSAVLNVTPSPDSVLRVFMAYAPLYKPIEIEEQSLDTFERTGFTVVEWGGAMVRSID